MTDSAPASADAAHDEARAFWEDARARAVAGRCSFRGVTFPPDPDQRTFAEVSFADDVDFHDAHFIGDVSFLRAHFAGNAVFRGTRFASRARFDEARFAGWANFCGTHFAARARFWNARFAGVAGFDQAHFAGEAVFQMAQFADVSFGYSRFDGAADFGTAAFRASARFEHARFAGTANFGSARFGGGTDVAVSRSGSFGADAVASFVDARFGDSASFEKARFECRADFTRAQFLDGASFRAAAFTTAAIFADAVASGVFAVDLPHRQGGTRTPFQLLSSGSGAYRLGKQSAADRGDYRLAGKLHFAEQSAICFHKLISGWRELRAPPGEGAATPGLAARLGKLVSALAELIFGNWLFGYGERLRGIAGTVIVVIVGFTFLFQAQGLLDGAAPGGRPLLTHNWFTCLYFSIVTFTTLGYGDLRPTEGLRLWAAGEGLLGAILMALFVVTMARKFTR